MRQFLQSGEETGYLWGMILIIQNKQKCIKTRQRRKWQPTPVFLPRESRGQKSLVGCCLWGRTESDTTEATWHTLEKEMAPHSSILASRIPGTEEPGGLLSMGVAKSQTRLKWLSSSSSIKTRAKLHGADLMKKLKKSGKNSWREGVFGVPEQFRIVVGKKDKKPYTWGALRRPV